MNLRQVFTPNNIAEEKKQFFAGTTYNPLFKYDWEGVKPEIPSNKPEKARLFEAVFSQDSEKITKEAFDYFNVDPAWSYLELVKNITAKKPDLNINFNVEDVKHAFEQELINLGFDEYTVEIADERGFYFRPSGNKKLLKISKYAKFEFFQINGMLRHELSHIIRYENSKHNNIPFSQGFLPTEEGLACLMQDRTQLDNGSIYQHACEYLASYIGINGSLRDIFNMFVSKGFSEELAWQRSIRHKFGFVDTSLPGDIIKPAMYYENSQKVTELSNSEILRLYSGKIRLDELDNYKKYSGRVSPEYLKEFFDLY